jgi:glycine amidinotransferase
MQVVNSHNEWDPLQMVIVGDGFSSELPMIDRSFDLFFHDNIYSKERRGYEYGTKNISKQYVEEMNEDVQNFADVLEQMAITVLRPKVPNKISQVKTPAWNSTNHNALNVRDQVIIIGDEIIETPGCTRYRYFENDLMRHHFARAFKYGAKWTQCPKPIMTDQSFDLSYVSKDHAYDKGMSHPLDMGIEMMWDGAQCMRFGTDILFNCSTESHLMGAAWLQRHLGSKYSVHTINACDNHIDSTIVPLRPGLLLVDAGRWEKVKPQLPKFLRSWDVVIAPLSETTHLYSKKDLKLASKSIDINVLSIDQKTLVCHDEYYPLLQPLLKPYGITCVPVRLRHSELFSGAFHCLTLDLKRTGDLQSYR